MGVISTPPKSSMRTGLSFIGMSFLTRTLNLIQSFQARIVRITVPNENKIWFRVKIVCPTALFEDVLGAIHSYGHAQVVKTVDLFDRKLGSLAYDSPRDRCDLSPDMAKIFGRYHECQTTKARRGKQPNTCEFAPVPQYPFTSLAIDFCKLPEFLQKSTWNKVDFLMVIVCRPTGMYWQSLVKKRDRTVRMLLP